MSKSSSRPSLWETIHESAKHVLAINQRNLLYVYPHNPRRHFPLADNKLLTKEALIQLSVPVPVTHKVYRHFYELRKLEEDLSRLPEFVIKPARGKGGSGIIVISGRKGADWVGISGKLYTLHDLKKHISDIIFGVYSFGLNDEVMVESRVMQHEAMNAISPYGLADIRIITFRQQPIMAMTRIPTLASEGKANLHQGAVGVGINLKSGCTHHAIHQGDPVSKHPDNGKTLIGHSLPFWKRVLEITHLTAKSVPLGYLGVDIVLAPDGPKVLEINVRPGIEIQNANMEGMREILESHDTFLRRS
ncbi:MAG: sugar-transfer associated ATP-grasp domain-containing protein [Mariprofundaceae bacterium]|nr:sugar-transfer associated ATP-grasp domain-containing protein [Mariprofundaceae bacterium]